MLETTAPAPGTLPALCAAAPRPLSWRAGKCLHGHSRTKPCVPLRGLHCISPRSPPPKTSECGLFWNKVSEDVTKMRLYWVGPKSKNVPFHTEGRPRDTRRDKRTQRLEQRGHKTSAAGSHQGLGEAGKTPPPTVSSGARLCPRLHLGLLASRAEREYICGVFLGGLFLRERVLLICSSTFLCTHWLLPVCAPTGDRTCNLGIWG